MDYTVDDYNVTVKRGFVGDDGMVPHERAKGKKLRGNTLKKNRHRWNFGIFVWGSKDQ